MTEQSSFKPGTASGTEQNKPSVANTDEYGGAYKEYADTYGEAEKFGTAENPVKHDALPARGLRGVGG